MFCRTGRTHLHHNTKLVFSQTGSVISAPAVHCFNCVRKHLFFNMSVLEDVEQLSFVQLEVKFKQDLAHVGLYVFSVDLYRVLRTTLKGVTHESSRKLLLSQSLGPGAHASMHVNLTELAESWRKPGKNYGMQVEMQLNHLSNVLQEHAYVKNPHSAVQIAQMPELYTSLVVVSLNPLQCRSRRKRSAAYYLPVTPSNVCKPEGFTLNSKTWVGRTGSLHLRGIWPITATESVLSLWVKVWTGPTTPSCRRWSIRLILKGRLSPAVFLLNCPPSPCSITTITIMWFWDIMKTWWWMSVDADELEFILNAEVHIFLKHIKMVLYTCSMIMWFFLDIGNMWMRTICNLLKNNFNLYKLILLFSNMVSMVFNILDQWNVNDILDELETVCSIS